LKLPFKPLLVRVYTFFVANAYKYSFRVGIRLVRFSRGGSIKQLAPTSGKLNQNDEDVESLDYKIVITTFSKRFFSDCLPLVRELRESGVTQEIIVAINGDFNVNYDQELRKNFLLELANFEGVSPVCFSTFRGLSVVWNRAILSGDAVVTVVLNDDLIVNRETVTSTLRILVEGGRKSGICLLNLSWSHFAISSRVFQDIGYFDERLLGIGEEDPDMTYRFEAYYGFTPPAISADGFIHDSSFEFDSKIKAGKGKYSLFNWAFIEKKYAFGEGMQSRMFDSPGDLVLADLPLYPAEEWRTRLQDYLASGDRDEIDSKIQEVISGEN
jgi:hypothetical protein